MSTLTCPDCGNARGWRDAHQDRDGTQIATCGRCGRVVRSTGGVVMDTVTGAMSQTR